MKYIKKTFFSIIKKIRDYYHEKYSSIDKNLEYEFLPASQEITESPSSPLGRATIWIIFLFLAFVVVWSYIGRVDKVVNAYGKIIPKGKLKIIKSMDGGVVTGIHVHEGEKVRKGQLLLELDNTIKKTDVNMLTKKLETSSLEKKFLVQELEGNKDNLSTFKIKNTSLEANIVNFQRMLNFERTTEFHEKIKAAKLNIVQKNKDLKITANRLKSLEDESTLLILEEKIERESYKNGFSSEIEWRVKKDKLDLNKHEIVGQRINIQKIRKNIEESMKKIEVLKGTHQTLLLEKIVEKDKEIGYLKAELTKAEKRFEYQRLTSPVDGIIHNLSTYTLGGIVNHSEAVISIIPEGTSLIAEVLVANRDVGFIKAGQKVELKIETFSFQDYGTIEGKILSISPDSIDEGNHNLVYKAQLSLKKDYLFVDGNIKKIIPGMTLTAEIKIGNRRIIDFFLSPFKKSVKEALIIR